ncbi:MAG: ADP-ribosylglycohydrolase family protein [Chloroflexi bacterium]|nr:ADP-ribosylglycohydrolase family protein [Chloroflexota bacterium]MCY3583627.1 ADP-ribosylglycohydrolase family protein [Chloroflexota bacterium]MCY3715902.1 ADP-ribosylglycohydrolase family protein [Chloroflexota bacterium]MDE2650063.1 ADP-ribosylglycohydrolase family protein [Chloroflexota bacterium]MXV94188.1 ADP-ribosylglycohydrolase family protein [Chloroflexota bacterium]
MSLPNDYLERVYAGVLGKLIGVYLGRPFEGWSYEAISEHLGEINYYVHDRLNVPLIVTDDDISGTFTFVRALQDYAYDRDVTAAQIGKTWLNYLVEEKTVLWWGGMGNSTEHTAYLRLKQGIDAPASGSIGLNGQVVAEQIGAQIFIDGWAMVAPGDPEFAADLAARAGSVSHDGEALYGAQCLAAMEAQAFIENDINKLIDTGLSVIPKDSIIYAMINDIREWHAAEPDWRAGRELLAERYGYHKYGGNCHMVPNHGLMIFSLLYGNDDFQRTLMIVNTCGWDTDCNSGNIGCLLGIKDGLAGLATGPDYRGPVADRLYIPTADGGNAISDAVTQTVRLVNIGRALQDMKPIAPKAGARYHFDLPGAVQGFMNEDSIEARDVVSISNVHAPALSSSGEHLLALDYAGLALGRVGRVETATFVPSAEVNAHFEGRGYSLMASPALSPGQTIRARVLAGDGNASAVDVALYIQHYNREDGLDLLEGAGANLAAGQAAELEWQVPDLEGYPIAKVGLQISGAGSASGRIYLDWLTWDGAPNVRLKRPHSHDFTRWDRKLSGIMWRRAWVNGLDAARGSMVFMDFYPETYRLIQNEGRGLMIHGCREWTDYQVSATMTPHMCKAGGLGARVQGMQRHYALLCDEDSTRLVATLEGEDTVLAQAAGGWQFGEACALRLKVQGQTLSGYVNDKLVVKAEDPQMRLTGGGIALIAEEGRIGVEDVAVVPV